MVGGCAANSADTSVLGENRRQNAQVTAIHDGDSITADMAGSPVEVRLDGINAPDRGECFFDEALEYLIETLGGRQVALEIADTDQFGRTLAYVHRGNLLINLDLVDKGLAIATTPGDDEPYGGELLAAEISAYQSGAGLWGEEVCGATGPAPEVIIESVHYDASGPDQDNIGEERVVITNQGELAVDLTGWILRDESSRHRYAFPEGTTLGPGESLTITSDDPGWDPGGSPVWNNTGDMALLLDPHGRVVDRHRY